MKADVVIIGAGISGAVLAEKSASAGRKVIVMEKRAYIAGNCYNVIDENEILVLKYGDHLFHTTNGEVWDCVNRIAILSPKNGEYTVLAKVGPILYEALFRDYTKKQWDKYPEELDASVLDRIPVRTDWNDQYFSDKYQTLSNGAYTNRYTNILNHPNITVCIETHYFDVKDVYFVGRLANYKYFNMDQAFKNALEVFEALEIYSTQMQA